MQSVYLYIQSSCVEKEQVVDEEGEEKIKIRHFSKFI